MCGVTFPVHVRILAVNTFKSENSILNHQKTYCVQLEKIAFIRMSPFSEEENESGQEDDLEEELNRALYYTDWDNIPEEVSQKYSIKILEDGTVTISRKLDVSEINQEPAEELSQEQEPSTQDDFKVETRASRVLSGQKEYTVVRVDEPSKSGSEEIMKDKELATPLKEPLPLKKPPPVIVDLEKEEAKYNKKRKISETCNIENEPVVMNEEHSEPLPKKKKNRKKRNKRKSLQDSEGSLRKKPRNESEVILLSDSGEERTYPPSEDDDVILNVKEPETYEVPDEETYPYSEDDDVILNITEPETYEVPDSDDEHQIGDFDWTQVESPSTWTSSMKRFYNKQSKELIEFDEKKIISDLRNSGLSSRDWFVNNKDLFMRNKKMRRCPVCKNADYHPLSKCPKRHVICFMCGEEGHSDRSCPRTLCLNCGKKTFKFATTCEKCMNTRGVCSICERPGHSEELCSDVWRRFHSTVSSDDPAPSNRRNDRVFCCNCAQQGHHYEDCPSPYYSKYEPTSSFITNYKGESQIFLTYEVILPNNVTVGHPSYQSLEKNSIKKGLKITRVQGNVPRVRVEGHLRKINAFRQKLALLGSQMPPKKKKNKRKNRRQKMVFV